MISIDGYGLVEYVIVKLGASEYDSSHFFSRFGPILHHFHGECETRTQCVDNFELRLHRNRFWRHHRLSTQLFDLIVG